MTVCLTVRAGRMPRGSSSRYSTCQDFTISHSQRRHICIQDIRGHGKPPSGANQWLLPRKSGGIRSTAVGRLGRVAARRRVPPAARVRLAAASPAVEVRAASPASSLGPLAPPLSAHLSVRPTFLTTRSHQPSGRSRLRGCVLPSWSSLPPSLLPLPTCSYVFFFLLRFSLPPPLPLSLAP